VAPNINAAQAGAAKRFSSREGSILSISTAITPLNVEVSGRHRLGIEPWFPVAGTQVLLRRPFCIGLDDEAEVFIGRGVNATRFGFGQRLLAAGSKSLDPSTLERAGFRASIPRCRFTNTFPRSETVSSEA